MGSNLQQLATNHQKEDSLKIEDYSRRFVACQSGVLQFATGVSDFPWLLGRTQADAAVPDPAGHLQATPGARGGYQVGKAEVGSL